MKSVKGIFRYLFPVRDGRELYWIKIPKGQSGRFGKEFIFEPAKRAEAALLLAIRRVSLPAVFL